MWRAALLAGLAATAGILATDASVAGQEQNRSEYIVFRVDGTHAIATIKVFDTAARQITDGLSAEPAARFGFQSFELPTDWRDRVPNGIQPSARWLIQTAPGKTVQATAERIVGGQLGCVDAIGVLLGIDAEQAEYFSALPARYFLGQQSTSPPPSTLPPGPAVRLIRSPSNDGFRRALESTLNELLVRELPAIRAEAEPDLERMASSSVNYHRSWARERRALDEATGRGEGKLTYDIQSFRLSPDAVPIHFVRAQWMVRGRQGFAATLWLRGAQSLEVVEQNVRPASWLHMFEFFRGGVAREHLGLILNVFDRNQDGWGELLMAHGGYESMAISLVEYSASGFHPTGIEYAYGC